MGAITPSISSWFSPGSSVPQEEFQLWGESLEDWLQFMFRFVDAEGTYRDGANLDTAAITAALARFGPAGGSLWFHHEGKYLTNSFTTPDNVVLRGGIIRPEQQDVGEQYYALGSQIRLNASQSVILGRGSSIVEMAILRAGQTQGPTNDAGATTLKAQFAGTGIQAFEVGHTIRDCLIAGHNVAIDATAISSPLHGGRVHIENVNIDSLSGVQLLNNVDICRLKNIHCWPFMTAHISGVSAANLQRPGVGLYFGGTLNDWVSADDCFSYAYAGGCVLENVANVTLRRCQVDTNSSAHTNIAFRITGTSRYSRLDHPTSVGANYGVYQDTTDAWAATQVNGGFFSNATACWNILDGNFIGNGATLESATYAVYIGPNAGDVVLDNLQIRNCTNGIYIDAAWAGKLSVGNIQFTSVTNKFVIPAAVRDRVTFAGGIAAADLPAYATNTPTITAGSGTFTTVSATGRYDVWGKTVFYHVTITPTNIGTAATSVIVPLPFTTGGGIYTGIAHNVTTGVQLYCRAGSGVSSATVVTSTNTFPAVAGQPIAMTLIYERN